MGKNVPEETPVSRSELLPIEAVIPMGKNRSCEFAGNKLSPAPLDSISSIPTGLARGYPLKRLERLFLAVLAFALTGLFVVATSLNPEPRGFGTHQQLGLPPCSLRTLFGIPCPTCGMTTSFAHFVRADLADACRANPAGLVVAVCAFLFIPWSLVGVYRGRLWGVEMPTDTALLLSGILVGLSLITWVIQIV